MKRCILSLYVTIVFFYAANGQAGVGIGTNTPNANAILDLTSTNKGFLPPRMTSIQRTVLPASPGMMVYDSNVHRLYYRDDAGWKYLNDNTFWTRSVSNAAIYNSSDNIGIGTSVPNTDAALHIHSTTKGLLIPSMTSTQRTAIASPPNGLMVFDNTLDRFYYCQNGIWKTLITNDYWAMTGTDLYTTGVNVGIGNANPSERLHVSGNIRTTGDFLTTGDILMNKTSGILQFQEASDNKGYVQLSGNNLRLGTNSGNSTGNVVVRMDGNDRITINPQGDMNTDGKITRPATGSKDMLPLCYGRVRFMATGSSMTPNVTVSRLAVGIYELTCADFDHNTTIIVTMNEYQGGFYAYPNVENWPTGSTKYKIHFYNVGSGNLVDAGFSFIAYK